MALLPLQLARVSNLLRTSVAHQNIARTQKSLLDVQNELSTGKKLNAPSDDPGSAAIAQQLRKNLEQRVVFASNLNHAASHLSEVDSTLGDMTDLLQQAQTIASANVGSDVTPDERAAAAEIVQSLYSQLLTLGNRQFEGVFLFAGDRSTAAPFVEDAGGVKFVGSQRTLENVYDENTILPFMVNGEEVFGAMSTRVEGSADLRPSLTALTRVCDLAGAADNGVKPASILLSNGVTSTVVDLSAADSVSDVINAINNAAVGSITASIAADGNSLQLAGGAGDNITINEVGGGTTAADLGILTTSAGGAGVPVDGDSLQPQVTLLTSMADLRGGAGVDTAGLVITNGLVSKTIDLSAANTVEDMLNAVNGSGTGVLARINAAGTGIDIINPVQGPQMTIGENGGTTAADLGIRSFTASAELSALNDGRGVGRVDGDDIRIVRRDGSAFTVDLSAVTTIQDAIDAINAADGGGGLTASFATTGNGIILADSTGGSGDLSVGSINFSTAAADLGIEANVAGNTITGGDVHPVQTSGVFANLAKLRSSLRTSDQAAITASAEALKADLDRVVRVRGQTGARVKEIESRQQRLEDQNVAMKSLLSNLEDTDFTEAISRFETLQTALQANYKTASKMLDLSLMDFLG